MQKLDKKGVSGTCSNPLCENPVVTHPKAIYPRRFCSDGCRLNRWVLSRVAEMLLPLGVASGWEILQKLENRDSPGKAKAEIVRFKAN